MTTTDKQVEQARDRVDKLNEQVAAQKAALATNATNGVNDLRIAQLGAEEDRLKAELEALKEANKPKVHRDAVSEITEQVTTGITEGGPTTAGGTTADETK